jgi:putative nucleotidyltransferase with HDIG domain
VARVLVVSPERHRARDVSVLLRQGGHQVEVYVGTDGWSERESELLAEVVIAPADATSAILAEASGNSRRFPPPLLLVQHDDVFDHGREIDLDDRLVDRIVTPFERDELLGRVDALARVRRVVLGTAAKIEKPTRSRGRLSWLFGPDGANDRELGAYAEVADRVGRWADKRDAFAPGHAERVTALCATMAEPLELGDEETSTLLRAAMLHDIGKVAVPVEVLHQRAPLDDGQRSMIRTHPKRGATLLRQLSDDHRVANVILHHHEQPDGQGYYGVQGEAVPMAARILAVAEVYDGMTTTRLRRPLSAGEALLQLTELRGQRLDTDAVDALAERIARQPESRLL